MAKIFDINSNQNELNIEDQDVITRISGIQLGLQNKFRPINEERISNYNMVVSRLQMTDKIRKQLEKDGRPANAYNKLSSVIKYITGLERANRNKMSIIGRTDDDHQYAHEYMDKVIDWILYTKNDLDAEVSWAALDAFIGMFGIIYSNWNMAIDPKEGGMFEVKRYNPLQITFDLDFTDRTWRKDCDFVFDTAWYTLDEIIKLKALNNFKLQEFLMGKAEAFFEQDEKLRHKKFISTLMSRVHDYALSYSNEVFSSDDYSYLDQNWEGNQFFNPINGTFKMTESHEKRTERFIKMIDPASGNDFDLTNDVLTPNGIDTEKLTKIREGYISQYRIEPRISEGLRTQIYITAVVPALDAKVQDEPYAVQNGNFMYSPIWGYDFHVDPSLWQSVVSELSDTQKAYNKVRNTKLELLMRFANAGTVVSDKAIEGYEEEWESREIGQMRRIKDAYWEKWKPDTFPNVPIGLVQEEEKISSDFDETSSVTKANRGMLESKSQPARLFQYQREQGETMLQVLFDNIDRTKKQLILRNAIDYSQAFLRLQRSIRLLDDFNNPYWMIINQATLEGVKNDMSKGEYDIEVSQIPYGKSKRETEYLRLLDLTEFIIKADPSMFVYILPILIKASDSPYKAELMQVAEMIRGIKEVEIQRNLAMDAISSERNRVNNNNQSSNPPPSVAAQNPEQIDLLRSLASV